MSKAAQLIYLNQLKTNLEKAINTAKEHIEPELVDNTGMAISLGQPKKVEVWSCMSDLESILDSIAKDIRILRIAVGHPEPDL